MQVLFSNKNSKQSCIVAEEDVGTLPRTQKGLILLCDYLEHNPFSDVAWQTLFYDFDHLLDKGRREKMIELISAELEPEMIRLILGECISVDEFFSEEKAMIESIPRSTSGAQQLIDYLRHNINCLYGWDIFFDRFYPISKPEQQVDAEEILKHTYDEHFLRLCFPNVFT